MQVLLLNVEGQNAFCHRTSKPEKAQDTPNFGSAFLHKEMNTSKGGKLILMATGYFLKIRKIKITQFPDGLHRNLS